MEGPRATHCFLCHVLGISYIKVEVLICTFRGLKLSTGDRLVYSSTR